MISFLVGFFLFFLAIFLVLLVLIQRGKGGGLAGAFGGMGGQSAFGTKAGDLFTRITIGVAAVWIVLCIFSVWYYSIASERIDIPSRPGAEQQLDEPSGAGTADSGGAPSPAAPPSSEKTP